MNGEIRLTRVKKQGGALLCKRIAADDHGHPVSDDGGPCAMARGTATRVRLNGSPAANLACEILDLGSHEALVVGDLADGLPDRIKLESPRKAQHQNAVRAHGHQKCPVHPVRPVLASSGAA